MSKKVYLITGASSDLGLATLEKLPLDSDDIIIAHYHSNKQSLEELADRRNIEIKYLQADFSAQDERARFVESLENLEVVPTHFVHLCAPLLKVQRFRETESECFERDFAVQVLSAAEILGFLLPHMTKQKMGVIVFVLSSCVLNKPPKFLSSYVASKYALLGLMRSLVSEYAGKHIRINAVSPSMIESKFLVNLDPKIVETAAYQNPVKRNASTSDVVPTILHLLDKSSTYLNGVNIPITGGSEF